MIISNKYYLDISYNEYMKIIGADNILTILYKYYNFPDTDNDILFNITKSLSFHQIRATKQIIIINIKGTYIIYDAKYNDKYVKLMERYLSLKAFW